jgi:hypothetical protein
MSKTPERISERMKPSAKNMTTAFIIQGGASNVARKMDAA